MKQETMMKKRKLQAMETKQRIFNATMSLIEEKGIENVQIEEISRKANVSMGLFYKYFANISDVVTEALNQDANQYYLSIKEKHLKDLRGKEKTLAFTYYVTDYHCNQLSKTDLKHNYATILMHSERGKLIINEVRPIYSILAECVQEMVQDGELPANVTVDSVAHCLALIIRGAVFEYLLNDNAFDIIGTAKHLVFTYIAGIKAEGCTNVSSIQ